MMSGCVGTLTIGFPLNSRLSLLGLPARSGPKDRVGHQILARKRLGRAGPIKMRPEKMLGRPDSKTATLITINSRNIPKRGKHAALDLLHSSKPQNQKGNKRSCGRTRTTKLYT